MVPEEDGRIVEHVPPGGEHRTRLGHVDEAEALLLRLWLRGLQRRVNADPFAGP
jgi:hypothetical protein